MYIDAPPEPVLEPMELLTLCIEGGAESLLLDEQALTPEFFDLSTGLAGELLHKLGNYRIRLGAVVPDPSIHSPRFQEFAREISTGAQCRFFQTRADAIRWLEAP